MNRSVSFFASLSYKERFKELLRPICASIRAKLGECVHKAAIQTLGTPIEYKII